VIRIGLTNVTDFPVYLPSITLDGVDDPSVMQPTGLGVAEANDGTATRSILLGFGEHVTRSWTQIDPQSTVYATYGLIPPFGGNVNLAQSHVDQTGGNADFHATVSINGALETGGDVSTTLGTLTAANVPGTGVYLSWSGIPGATQYNLYRSTDRYYWDQSNLVGTFDSSAGAYM